MPPLRYGRSAAAFGRYTASNGLMSYYDGF
jgi:hypothetical protein